MVSSLLCYLRTGVGDWPDAKDGRTVSADDGGGGIVINTQNEEVNWATPGVGDTELLL